MRISGVARTAAASLALFLAQTVRSQEAVSTAAQSAEDEIETLLVTGEQPGPGLWKVSRGDHVLWILAGSGPLPKDVVWRSEKVEALVAESQEVLYQGFTRVGPDIGMLRALTMLPSMLKAAKNPGGAKLKDVLPPESYEKWRVLREKYVGMDDSVEKWRPTFALNSLRAGAYKQSGLTFATSARAVVDKAARKHKVRTSQPPVVERQIHIEDPRGILKKMAKQEFDDLECFDRGLERLESGLGEAKVAANAWSTGDIESLRDLHARARTRADAQKSCDQLILQSVANLKDEPGAKEAIDSLLRQAEIAQQAQDWNWLQAARNALAKNQTTFAILPTSQLFDPDGYVAKLRAEGYEVKEP